MGTVGQFKNNIHLYVLIYRQNLQDVFSGNKSKVQDIQYGRICTFTREMCTKSHKKGARDRGAGQEDSQSVSGKIQETQVTVKQRLPSGELKGIRRDFVFTVDRVILFKCNIGMYYFFKGTVQNLTGPLVSWGRQSHEQTNVRESICAPDPRVRIMAIKWCL